MPEARALRPSEPGTQTTCPGPGFCAAPSHNATPPDRNRGLSPAPPPGFRRRGVARRTRVLWPALRRRRCRSGAFVPICTSRGARGARGAVLRTPGCQAAFPGKLTPRAPPAAFVCRLVLPVSMRRAGPFSSPLKALRLLSLGALPRQGHRGPSSLTAMNFRFMEFSKPVIIYSIKVLF